MSAAILLITVLLTDQARAANDRYGTDSATPSGNPASAGAPASRVSPPPRTSQPPPAATTTAAGEDEATSPYTPRSSAPPANNPFAPLNSGTAQPPATGGSQPPFRPSAPPAGQGVATSPIGSTPSVKPSAVMKQVFNRPAGSELTGSPLTLIDAVSGARNRQAQAHCVEAYWDLCSSVADYYLGVLEQGEMQSLRAKVPRAGAAMQQAEAKFAVRLATSKQAAVASQRRLASMIGRAGDLPLPVDLPHCGSYESRYDEIFASRPSDEAKELAALLKMRYAELKEYAAAVVQTRSSLDRVASNDSGDGTETVRALELLALQRRAFVQIARDYNRRIARYAELSTPGEIGAERLVGMLIKTTIPPTATRPRLPSGTDGRQSRSSTPPPRTFANEEGWEPAERNVSRPGTRDESVRPASAENNSPREERSLLVSPR